MPKIEELIVEIGATTNKLEKGLKRGEKQISGFGKQIRRLGGLIAGAFAVSKIATFTLATVKLAGEAQGVERAFRRIANSGTLEELRRSTYGTVSNLELMRKTVQASNFGLPVKQLGELFGFATRRAQQTGESVDYLVNSIVLGIGRKSPLILDNLGISAIRLRKELKGAGSEMATTFDVAAAVARIAREEMEKMGSFVLTTKDRFAQLKANVENLRIEMGENLLPITDKILKVFNKLFEGSPTRLAGSATEKLVENLNKLKPTERLEALNKSLLETSVQYADLRMERDLINRQGIFERDQERLRTINNLLKGTEEYFSQFGELSDKGFFIKDTEKLEQFLKTLEEVGKIKPLGLIGGIEAELTLLDKMIKEAPSETLITKLRDQVIELEAELKRLNELIGPDKKRGAFADFIASSEAEESLKNQTELIKLQAEATNASIETEKAYAKEQFDRFQQYQDDTAAYKTIQEQLGEVLVTTFSDAASSMTHYGESFGSVIKGVIAATIAKGVAMLVGNALETASSLGPYGFLLAPALASAAGGLALAAFNSIPSFANEGRVSGPTLAMMGDYPGASSNPEYALKESTLKSLTGNQRIHITGKLIGDGRSLIATIDETNAYTDQIY